MLFCREAQHSDNYRTLLAHYQRVRELYATALLKMRHIHFRAFSCQPEQDHLETLQALLTQLEASDL